MKVFIACLLLGTLVGVTPPPVSAQQDQSPQHSAQEIESLKNRVLELEKQLQIVENVEKLELQAKLGDANAKLLNAEFGKLERDLRDSNDEWLRTWSHWFLVIISVFIAILIGVGTVFWFWLKSTTNQLIADRVEKSLNGFKEALDELKILKNQQRVLEKEHAVSTLEYFIRDPLLNRRNHPEQIKGLREEALLDIFGDEGRILAIRYKAAEVLTARESPRLVSPTLEILNSVVDSNSDIDFEMEDTLRDFIHFLGHIYTQEAYEGLTRILRRLLTGSPKQRDLFLTWTALSLSYISVELNKSDSVPILRTAVPHLKDLQLASKDVFQLATYFDKFNEPNGIEELLNTHRSYVTSEDADKCLELLQKYNPEFVEEWRARESTDNS